MKPLIQKLPLDEGASFVARTYETPNFEVPWHQHEELELILLNSSSGITLVGNHIGEYEEGDVYFFGKNLPHGFRKQEGEMIGNAMVVQFREEIFGEMFLDLPELAFIKKAIRKSRQGMKLQQDLKQKIAESLVRMESQRGFQRIRTLLDCLHLISRSNQYYMLTDLYFQPFSQKDQDKIGIVFEYSMQHFREGITIEQMAALINLSVSSFCKYFKKTTKKTYIEFLNEIKIGNACKLLKETDKTISEICYDSGYRTWANFSKHFKKICGMPPSEYRRTYV